jgi:hypothetical protein
MSGRLSDLASRMRAAVQEEERDRRLRAEAAERVEAERARLAAEAGAARDAVLSEIEEFGKALGLVEVRRTRSPKAVRLERDGRRLSFLAGDEDRVNVTGAAEGVFLTRESDGSWIAVWPGDPDPVRRPLEAALEELLVTGLGFPRARPSAKPAKAPPPKKPVHTLVVDTATAGGARAKGDAPLVGGSVREFKGPLD